MPTYRFEPAKGPVILANLPLRHVFQASISLPAAGVVIAFLIGYTVHTPLMYDYHWGCRKVYLPSVSRVLNLPLERIAWNVLTLASVPLQVFVVLRQYILTFSTSSRLNFLRIVLVVSSAFQTLFLTLVATVGERESGSLHVAFFSAFAVSTIINYTAFSILMKLTSRDDVDLGRQRISVLLGLMITLPIIFITFILHNVFCIAGAYEGFAVFEYLTIVLIYYFNFSNRYLFNDASTNTIQICQKNGRLLGVRI